MRNLEVETNSYLICFYNLMIPPATKKAREQSAKCVSPRQGVIIQHQCFMGELIYHLNHFFFANTLDTSELSLRQLANNILDLEGTNVPLLGSSLSIHH